MKIDRKMEIGGKPFKIYDQESNGVTTLWSSNGQRNFPQMSRNKKLIAEDIFGLLSFRYTWGGFGDLTIREQLENKFDSFWYNAKPNRYWFQLLFPLMEGQPQLKRLVAEKLQLDFTGVSRLKVRDSASESIGKAIWEKRKMRDIYEPFKDAFFSQRGTANLPEQEGSSLEKGTIVIAMKLNEGQGASFAGVRVFSDDSSSTLKSAIQKEATNLYRGFIAPHTSIFENRMRDEYMSGGYTVYDSEGYNELMAAELEAMIPTLFGGNVSIRSASSEDSLRNKIIRLAHQNPKLRDHLLPLVAEKTAGISGIWTEVLTMLVPRGWRLINGDQWSVTTEREVNGKKYVLVITLEGMNQLGLEIIHEGRDQWGDTITSDHEVSSLSGYSLGKLQREVSDFAKGAVR